MNAIEELKNIEHNNLTKLHAKQNKIYSDLNALKTELEEKLMNVDSDFQAKRQNEISKIKENIDNIDYSHDLGILSEKFKKNKTKAKNKAIDILFN